MKDEYLDIPRHLIIPKADNPQPHLSQHLLPPPIFLFLQIVDITIHLNNQRDFMTVKVHDESRKDLLSPKAAPNFFARTSCHTLRGFLGRRHLTAEFFPATDHQDGKFIYCRFRFNHSTKF